MIQLNPLIAFLARKRFNERRKPVEKTYDLIEQECQGCQGCQRKCEFFVGTLPLVGMGFVNVRYKSPGNKFSKLNHSPG
jgi:coenzyme F420-reducing hydrogenase gamma subunit